MSPKEMNSKDMTSKNLTTYAKNQWCPGCANFGILNAVKSIFKEMSDEGFPLENIVVVSGIGQHAKIVDYLNVNSFYSIHGRTLPAATAIKLSNPELKVICFSGDGDSLAEGLDHLIFAAKRNIDLTMILHDNRVYGLTTGQYTPTSPLGFRGKSTPKGTEEYPMNPLEIMLSSGASFIARAYPGRTEHFKKLLKDAIMHKGFSFVDVLQVCVTYNNLYDFYNKRIYELKDNDPSNFDEALKLSRSWDYNSDAPVAIGKFFEKDMPRFDEMFPGYEPHKVERDAGIKRALDNFI